MKKRNFPHEAIAVMDEVLQYGSSKYSAGYWRTLPMAQHIDKAMGHLKDYLYGIERGEDHLACALTRLAMALSIREQEKKK